MLVVGIRDQCGQLTDPLRNQAQERVCAELAGNRPLGVVPQGEAGDPEEGCLLLDPARVRQDAGRLRHEPEELKVADWLGYPQPVVAEVEAERLHRGARPGMGRKHNRQLLRHSL